MDSKEIADMIETTLNEILPEMDDHEDGDILVEWAVVTYVTNPNNEESDAYPTFFPSGSLPPIERLGYFEPACST